MGSQELLGRNIKKLRKKLGLTQAQVANKADIHVNFFARIEWGEENPTYETLEKLARALDAKSSDFLPF